MIYRINSIKFFSSFFKIFMRYGEKRNSDLVQKKFAIQIKLYLKIKNKCVSHKSKNYLRMKPMGPILLKKLLYYKYSVS